ncbi:hypothetical protein Sste5346_004239 [Sporothrix stenoceras]|uniref:Non-haem dioxygenase N-terminal domain-containing protein n=1 Tax=Sporothrix stenoceras TaxID=5173 RepID=A0ABR3Z9N3_9PEZI
MSTTKTTIVTNTTVNKAPEQQYVVFHGARGEGKRPIPSGSQMKKTFKSISQIDFAKMHGSLKDRQALAAQVKSAFTKCGFLYACNHGISEELQAQVLDVMKAFFALPTEEKVKIHINNSPEIKGYECLFETKLDTRTRGDMKEALNFGDDPTEPERNCPPDFDLSYYPGNGTVPINQWPAQPANFRDVLYQYHAAVMAFSRQLLHIVALALDLDEDFFDTLTVFPMAGLRPLYYPPQELAEDIGIGAHAGYSWFTVVNQLAFASSPITGPLALEVLNANGHWGAGTARYSLPFFFSPSHDALVDIVPTCWSEERPKTAEPILAGVWQRERLYRSRYKHPTAVAARGAKQ